MFWRFSNSYWVVLVVRRARGGRDRLAFLVLLCAVRLDR